MNRSSRMLDEFGHEGVYLGHNEGRGAASRVNDYVMRIAICDDDAADLNHLAEMVRRVAAQEHITCEVTCYDSSVTLLAVIEAGECYHALMLDVMMPELDGMRLAAALRQRQNNASIVFVSANPEMALQGYEVAASRFLAKPAREDKLQEALLYCYRAGQPRQDLTILTARGMRKLSADDIVYIETWGRGVRFHLQNGQEEGMMKISELESVLPADRFVLCHRTILVNLVHVRYLRYCELELKSGAVLPVSKYRQNATRDKLMNYLQG